MEFLKPSQIQHTKRLINILLDSPFACDFSVMGAGKTYVANAIGIELGLPLFVLGQRGSLNKWESTGNEMDQKLGRQAEPNVKVTLTYDSLRSVKNHQPKNGYLTRYDFTDAPTEFIVTDKFIQLVESGIILVVDECQKIKNNGDQTRAVRALINEIVKSEGYSRILFLSGTPFEKDELAINFFHTIGFCSDTNLVTEKKKNKSELNQELFEELLHNLRSCYGIVGNRDPYQIIKELDLSSYQEEAIADLRVMRDQRRINEENLTEIIPRLEAIRNEIDISELIRVLKNFRQRICLDRIRNNPNYRNINTKNINKFLFELFTEIIVPFFSSAMSSPVMDFKKDVGNGYFVFKGPDAEEKIRELSLSIQDLQKASAYDSEQYGHRIDFGKITLALERIEQAKIPLFVRIVKEELSKGEKNKVIIFVNYHKTIDSLCQELEEYEPLVYDGRLTNRKQENDVIEAFNNGGKRLLIANLKKGGVSISLHDTKGDEPRTSFISPNYSILDMHQASGRTYRENTKSDVVIRVVYGQIPGENESKKEQKILNSLARKTGNLKQILKVQAAEGVLFPGEYPEYTNL